MAKEHSVHVVVKPQATAMPDKREVTQQEREDTAGILGMDQKCVQSLPCFCLKSVPWSSDQIQGKEANVCDTVVSEFIKFGWV